MMSNEDRADIRLPNADEVWQHRQQPELTLLVAEIYTREGVIFVSGSDGEQWRDDLLVDFLASYEPGVVLVEQAWKARHAAIVARERELKA